MISATKGAPVITGVDALGPRQLIMRSANHIYRRLDSGVFLHVQNFARRSLTAIGSSAEGT